MNTETITDNEVIARFMEIKQGKVKNVFGELIDGYILNDYGSECSVVELRYDSSWEWLMPVVEKIESECGASVEIRQGYCGIIHHRTREWQTSHMGSKIESTYKAVVQFIQWYTQNKEI